MELARACDIEPATVSKILDLMEQAGMIERVRSDKDRRSIQVQITEFGAQQHAKMSEIHAEVEALALEAVSYTHLDVYKRQHDGRFAAGEL